MTGIEDKNVLLAYLAGLIDGEGCFTIGTAGKHLALKVTNTDCNLLSQCKVMIEKLGYNCGFYPHYKDNSKNNRKWKNQWSIQLLGGRSGLLAFCKEIEPFLIGKKGQCNIVISYLTSRLERYPGRSGSRFGRSLTLAEVFDLEKLRQLNKRGAA